MDTQITFVHGAFLPQGIVGLHHDKQYSKDFKMQIATAWSTQEDGNSAITQAYESLQQQLGAAPDLLVFHCSTGYDSESLFKQLRSLAPGSALHGGTSCQGVMTQAGYHSADGRGLGLLGIVDEDGSYGVGVADLGDDPKAAAELAASRALEHAEEPGAIPDMVWITAAPGAEEQVIAGIENLFGQQVPIAGGSSGDNAVSGVWKQFANDEMHENAVVVSVLFPDADVMFAFHSGYEPTKHSGTVTKAENRILLEIDGRPAAKVYDEWTEGVLSEHLQSAGNVLGQTTLFPLGREVGHVGNVPYYELSHPDTVREDGGLTLFADTKVGDKFILMKGSQESLVTRAGRVAETAMKTNDKSIDDLAGALVIYCAGCMLTVQDSMGEVAKGISDAIGGHPFLGTFTFGEQGCFLGGENRHGNLMISVLLFGK